MNTPRLPRNSLGQGAWVSLVALILLGPGCSARRSPIADPPPPPHATPGAPLTSAQRQPDTMRTSFGEPTIEEAVMMLTMRTGGEFPDCDSNGIPDSLDILEGRIADRNHDGVDDFCDEDRRVQDEAYARTWKDLLFQRDTAHVFVRHLPNEHVWIQYTVPISGSRVTLEVINPRGSRVRTISRGWQPPGAHEVLWDKRDSAGRRVQPDVDYTVRLRQDSRSYSRTTRWRDRK